LLKIVLSYIESGRLLYPHPILIDLAPLKWLISKVKKTVGLSAFVICFCYTCIVLTTNKVLAEKASRLSWQIVLTYELNQQICNEIQSWVLVRYELNFYQLDRYTLAVAIIYFTL